MAKARKNECSTEMISCRACFSKFAQLTRCGNHNRASHDLEIPVKFLRKPIHCHGVVNFGPLLHGRWPLNSNLKKQSDGDHTAHIETDGDYNTKYKPCLTILGVQTAYPCIQRLSE